MSISSLRSFPVRSARTPLAFPSPSLTRNTNTTLLSNHNKQPVASIVCHPVNLSIFGINISCRIDFEPENHLKIQALPCNIVNSTQIPESPFSSDIRRSNFQCRMGSLRKGSIFEGVQKFMVHRSASDKSLSARKSALFISFKCH
jgi:hypothetical protein